MTTFYMLWILLASNTNQQATTVDHFGTLAECQAAAAQFIAEYNAQQPLSIMYIGDKEVKCFKVEVK